jgi:hypothetical protein
MSTLRTTNVIHGSSAISNIVLDNQGRSIFGPDSPAGRAALYVNAQNNRVGVNTETPAVALDVNGAINATTNVAIGGTLTVTGTVSFDGNVGIGTNNPATSLNIRSDSSDDGILLEKNDGTDIARLFYDGTSTNARLDMFSGGTANIQLRADGISHFSGGNVGIGTNGPGDILTVGNTTNAFNAIRIQSTNTGIGEIRFADSDSINPAYIKYEHNSNDLVFAVNGAERVHLDSNGHLGLGDNDPYCRLKVMHYELNTTNIRPDNSIATFGAVGSNGIYVGFLNSQTLGYPSYIQSGFLDAGGTVNYPLLLNPNSGNVGIGKTSLNSTFEIYHDTVPYIYLQNSTTGTSASDGFSILESGVDTYINNREAGNMLFYNNGDERMRIRSDGHVLIGTTTFAGTDGITLRSDGYVVTPVTYSYVLSGSTRDLSIDDDGYLGIITSVRDAKANIQNQNDVDWLYQLEPVTFNYKTRDRETGEYTGDVESELEYGLIAEDVETVCPDLCFYDETDDGPELRGVSYKKLITPMLKALQKAQERIETLEANNLSLENRIAALENS